MLWDILGAVFGGLFEPGPPTSEKSARRQAVFLLLISLGWAIAGVALIVVGASTADPDLQVAAFPSAALCVFLAGYFWYAARRMVLDQREGR